MSYDICVLGKDGSPIRQVSLNVDEHYSIIEAARKLKLHCFFEIGDYYSDFHFSLSEIPHLKKETQLLISGSDLSNLVLEKLKALLVLCDYAEKSQCGICAIAD